MPDSNKEPQAPAPSCRGLFFLTVFYCSISQLKIAEVDLYFCGNVFFAKKIFVKRISVLSLLLVLFSVIFGVEAAQAQDSPLTVNDCLKLLDRTLGEDDYASILKSKGFEKMEIPDEGEYDHHYFFLSKGEGIILEIYGAYDDTGSTDYVDISFATPISAYFLCLMKVIENGSAMSSRKKTI